LDPDDFDIEDVEENEKICEDHFLREIHTVQIVKQIGHGPKYLDYFTQIQGNSMPFPERLVDIIVMSRVPGEILGDIYKRLSDTQLRSIRTQLTSILE
jgi:serine/threonine protein kinase